MDARPLLLKVVATSLSLAATVLSAAYVTAHLKNPSAPLRPSVLSVAPSVQQSNAQPVTSTYAS